MNVLFTAIGGWLIGRGLTQRRRGRDNRRKLFSADVARRRAAYLDEQRRRSA